jgi:hypothetical protein
MSLRKKLKRGSVRKADCVFIGAWVPVPMSEAVNDAIILLDSDRSKFLRIALEEKMQRVKEVA